MAPLLKVDRATKRFGGLEANKQISLQVEPGEIVGLIGPNGSGKTVLFKSIVGHHSIDHGSIHFDGRDITGLKTGEIARRGLIRAFQQTQIYEKMSCLDGMRVSIADRGQSFIDMFGRYPPEVDERANELLDLVGLYAKRHERARELSFGQQKLLEFSMGLMNEPKMLLLDEPTAGINPTLINGVMDRLRRANDQLSVTLLVIEHNMRVIMDLAERIYCLARGELLAEGSPDTIRNDPMVIEAYLGGRQ